jgi:hypothetical protein
LGREFLDLFVKNLVLLVRAVTLSPPNLTLQLLNLIFLRIEHSLLLEGFLVQLMEFCFEISQCSLAACDFSIGIFLILLKFEEILAFLKFCNITLDFLLPST